MKHPISMVMFSIAFLIMTNTNAVPLLKMQFTDDTVDSAPATASAVQGGVSVKPTNLYVYNDTSILVRSAPIDANTNEMFEYSKVLEILDNSTTAGPTVRFEGNTADSASGNDKVRIDLDLMIDSSISRSGNMFINMKQASTGTIISSIGIGLSAGTISLSNYNSSGSYLNSTTIGVAPEGKSFHLQIQLDYSTGAIKVNARGLLYTPDSLACTTTATGTFANNISFGRLDISSGTTSTGKVLLDNISINAVPALPEADISTYGAVGDGTTDDTSAISSALSALGYSIGKLTFGANKTYIISSGVNISSKKDFTIEGNNATIKVKDNTPVQGGYHGIQFASCENFTVQNLTVDGNRNNRVPVEAYAHSIIIRGCRLFDFYDVTSNNAVTDGVYVSAYTPSDAETISRNGLFLNFSTDNCFRQGISIINGHHIYVVNGEFKNSNGTSPEAGIDVESNDGSCEPGNMDVVIRNSKFTGNNGYGVQLSSEAIPRNLTVEDCMFSDNNGGGITLGAKYSLIRNNFFEDFTQSIRGIIDFPATVYNEYNLITNNWFNNIQTGQAVIYVHRLAGDYNEITDNIILDYDFVDDDGIYARNATTIVDANRTSLAPVGHWALDEGTGSSLTDSSGNNIAGTTYNNPSWVSGEYDYALCFNGSNQYALIDNNSLLDVTDCFTLSAWFYADADSSSASHIVIGKSADFRLGYTSNSTFGLYASSAIDRWVTATVSKGAWHHVAATYNGSRVRLYIDGTLANEAVVKPGNIGTAYQVHIGSYSSTTYLFDGIIDDVRIYDTVLSESEINNL